MKTSRDLARAATDRPATPDLAEPAHPAGGPLLLADRSSIRAAGVQLADGARRELLIVSRDLDPDLYDQLPFLDAVRRLALATPRSPVRVLVAEPRLPVTGGHRLIELTRTLSSRISIRRVADDFRDRVDSVLIADTRDYCLHRAADRNTARVAFNAPGEARRLRAAFEQIWEQSDGDSELRQLYI
jgi:hypothetical protein